ncbi:hypothetical protein C3K47_18835 [Solitalea longa]|uniref:Uncharacterized protein n=1 Tax=Solitalea longa TaxID=2079460 RepID=A0A2S4ZXT1_9SPHI|nr:hypothetical protein C3K47_18835 [Solitalea longa]
MKISIALSRQVQLNFAWGHFENENLTVSMKIFQKNGIKSKTTFVLKFTGTQVVKVKLKLNKKMSLDA